MDSSSSTGSTPSSGMTQAQADNLSRIGLSVAIIEEIRQAKLPDSVLSKLETATSPKQLADEVGSLWLPSDLVERIRNAQPAELPGSQARVELPAPDMPTPSSYTPPPTQPPAPYGEQPPPGYGQAPQTPPGYGQGQMPPQGGYAPPQGAPPQGYGQPTQQMGQPYGGYPQQQPGAPVYGQQPYPAAPQAPAKKGGVPGIVWVLGGVFLGIILCVVIVMAAVGAFVNSASKAITEIADTAVPSLNAIAFTTSLETGDWKTARTYLNNDMANRWSEDQLRDRWQAINGESSFGTTNSDLGTATTSGNRVTVPWSFTGANGTNYKVDLIFGGSSDDYKIVDAKPDLIPNP